MPGDYAAGEARKALRSGLDVMIFSDNVPLEEEVALKREAKALGRLVMGPDCGTAIIDGTPLAFANRVPRGDIGVIGASGTGMQEVTCLIAQAGKGISQAIGVGGRDLAREVGALSTLAAIDLLDADPATRHIVLISKPPHPDVARVVLTRVGQSRKPFTICFLGATGMQLPANARAAPTCAPRRKTRSAPPSAGPRSGAEPAAEAGCDPGALFRRHAGRGSAAHPARRRPQRRLQRRGSRRDTSRAGAKRRGPHHRPRRRRVHPRPPAPDDRSRRPHRQAARRRADPSLAVILLDVVIGFGAHPDPAGQIASPSRARRQTARTSSPRSPARKPTRKCARARSSLCSPPAC